MHHILLKTCPHWASVTTHKNRKTKNSPEKEQRQAQGLTRETWLKIKHDKFKLNQVHYEDAK